MRILLLNCFSRNSLAVINSLDKSYRIIGGTSNRGLIRISNTIFKSRRVDKTVHITDPCQDPLQFRNNIIEEVIKCNIDAVLATGTTSTDYLSFYKKEIMEETNAKVIVEDYEKQELMTDKWNIYKISTSLGITAPKTALLSNYRKIKQIASDNEIEYPILIKPRISFGSKGVSVFHSEGDVTNFIKTIEISEKTIEPNEYVLQEKISGTLHDVTSCSKNGSIISMLSQERLLTKHDFGGGGIINRTTYVPGIMNDASKILTNMSWNGIAEFDFIKDSNGKFYLLECNPKIWGTTQLTIEAGLNMPQQLIDSLYFNIELRRKHNYEIGVVYKWLFPNCVAYWFEKPLTYRTFFRRFYRTLKAYQGTRTINNVQTKSVLHLIGIALNKSMI